MIFVKIEGLLERFRGSGPYYDQVKIQRKVFPDADLLEDIITVCPRVVAPYASFGLVGPIYACPWRQSNSNHTGAWLPATKVGFHAVD